MTHRRRSPRALAPTLTELRRVWEPASALGRAQSAWEEVAGAWRQALGAHGSYIVERTRPVSLSGGVLTVACSEAAVAQTLALESERVLEALNVLLSGEPVRRLRCLVEGAG